MWLIDALQHTHHYVVLSQLVDTPPTASDTGDGLKLGNFVVPGSVIAGLFAVYGIVRKARSTDRVELSKDQNEHMDRLTQERNEALDHARDAQKSVDNERRLRRDAENTAAGALVEVTTLKAEVMQLTQQVTLLTTEIHSLRQQVQTLASPPPAPVA